MGLRIASASLAEKEDTQQRLDHKSQTGNMNINNTAHTGGHGGVGGTVNVNIDSDKDNDKSDAAGRRHISSTSNENPNNGHGGAGYQEMSQGQTVILIQNQLKNL